MKLFFSLFLLCFSVVLSHGARGTYIGVYAIPVEPSMSSQLGLPENLHLSVQQIEKNSPASKAGIEKFDVLLRLDDQILINPEQLKYLVRSKKVGDKVTIHLLRKGEEMELSLTLDEVELSQTGPERKSPSLFDLRERDLDRLDDHIDRLFRGDDLFLSPHMFKRQNKGTYFRKMYPHDLDEDPLHSNSNTQSISQQSSKSQIMMSDEMGTIEWNEEDGKKTFRATDKEGQILFEGPINTDEERSKLSKELRTRLEKLEGRISVP